MDRHKAKLEAELAYLRQQYNEIEQIKTAVYNNQNIGAPQAVAQAASEVKCADKDGNPEPCELEKPEEPKGSDEQEPIGGEQQTQLAKMGDGTFEDGAFEGLSQMGIIVVSVLSGAGILIFLALILYCFRSKKGKTL